MRKLIFVFLLTLPLLAANAQQRQIWSTVARGSSLPSKIPRAGYLFFRTSDSTLFVSTGTTWLNSASSASAATVSSLGVWYLKPIEFAVDSAAALADSMIQVWQNTTGGTRTLDSIHVAEKADDIAYIFRRSDYNGGNFAVIDTVTASTNGTGIYYKTNAVDSTLTAGQRLWMKRPSSSGASVYVRIHYH